MRLLTRQQFIQYNPEATEDLNEWRARFVAAEDPTEYDAAIELVGSWAVWEKFKKDWPTFKNSILKEWHIELDVHLRSKAIKKMTTLTDNAGAMRWLAEGKFRPAPDKRTKEEKDREQQVKDAVAKEVDEDVSRVLEANVVKFDRS